MAGSELRSNSFSVDVPAVAGVSLLDPILDELRSNGYLFTEVSRASIVTAAETIVEAFEIRPEFFDDGVRSLKFAAIAERYALATKLWEDKIESDLVDDLMSYFGNLVLLTAKGFSDGVDELLAQMMPEISDAGKRRSYDRFTNWEVSDELANAVTDTEMLNETRRRLGITEDAEFDVRVLNIANRLVLEGLFDEDDIGSSQEASIDAGLYDAYQMQLKRNYRELAIEIGLVDPRKDKVDPESSTVGAWVAVLDGVPCICFPLPLAEKILYEDERRPLDYDWIAKRRDVAILAHEFVHVHGSITNLSPNFLGLGLEELRAENYSGNLQAYGDIKEHFAMIAAIDGPNVIDILDSFGPDQPYSTKQLLIEICKVDGLGGCLDVLSVIPSAYDNSGVRPLEELIRSTGGMPGLKKDFVYRSKAYGRARVVERGLSEYIGSLNTTGSSQSLGSRRSFF